jgi:hypothetical protein
MAVKLGHLQGITKFNWGFHWFLFGFSASPQIVQSSLQKIGKMMLIGIEVWNKSYKVVVFDLSVLPTSKPQRT